MAGIAGITALGIPDKGLFALPQGGWDSYVESAIGRTNIKHVRGISGYNNLHTLIIGTPTGDNSADQKSPSGWITQLDAVQTDGATTDLQVKAYIDDLITYGATGANYHHGVTSATGVVLDSVCAHLKEKSDLGLIEVVTAEQVLFDDI